MNAICRFDNLKETFIKRICKSQFFKSSQRHLWINTSHFEEKRTTRLNVRVIKCALFRATNCELYRTHYDSWNIPWARRRRTYAFSRFPCTPGTRARGGGGRGGSKDAESNNEREFLTLIVVADVRKHWNPFTFRARGNPAPRGAPL